MGLLQGVPKEGRAGPADQDSRSFRVDITTLPPLQNGEGPLGESQQGDYRDTPKGDARSKFHLHIDGKCLARRERGRKSSIFRCRGWRYLNQAPELFGCDGRIDALLKRIDREERFKLGKIGKSFRNGLRHLVDGLKGGVLQAGAMSDKADLLSATIESSFVLITKIDDRLGNLLGLSDAQPAQYARQDGRRCLVEIDESRLVLQHNDGLNIFIHGTGNSLPTRGQQNLSRV